ncbi:MAG: glycoside hydrolase family 25 protein [Lachnospiraceae bacterium]
MKKNIVLLILCFGMIFMLSGCQKDYYGFGIPFNMSTSKLPGYYNAEIGAMCADNYERFMHASYIRVIDKFGNEQKIKISANIKRNNWDFENLDDSGAYKTYIDDEGKRKIGIDVSEHQGLIDWETVADYVDFAIIRIGYRGYTGGSLVLDGYYSHNIQEATAHGIPVGVYFYSQAISYDEGVEEANFVLNNLGDYGLAYPIVLDREDPMQEDARTNDMSKEQHTDAAKGFLDTIKASGHRTMVYTNRMYYALYLDTEEMYQHSIWYAQYADEPDWPYEFAIWQYTESGTVPGISGTVDMNIQMMDID